MEEMVLEAKEEFNGIIEFVTREALTWELHSVEEELFRRLLKMGRTLLMLCLGSVGTGHVGPSLATQQGSVLRYRRTSPRKYLSIFGEVEILRAYYLKDGGKGVFPVEARLNLPKRMYSYLLQRWMTLWGVQTTYEKAVEFVGDFLGLKLAHRPIQRVARDLTPVVNEFNDSLEIPEADEEGPILIETLDGKGIPMCKPDPDQPKKGEKQGKKKMALVTATMSADPYEHQTAQDIAERLVNEGPQTRRSKKTRRAKPHHKRIIASLTRRDAVMDKAQRAAMKRIHPHTELMAVLGDGEKKIWKSANELFPGWLQVLDIIHVRDKLRLAADLYYKKGSSAGKEYVKERLVALLTGEVDMVIEDFRIALEDGGLSPKKTETLRRMVLGYFETNRDRMRYDKFMAMGLPIGSGVIEGTCKNLINDRMERSGMRWSPEGAEAILQLRAAYLCDQWNEFWAFRTEREKRVLYAGQDFVPKHLSVQQDMLKAA